MFVKQLLGNLSRNEDMTFHVISQLDCFTQSNVVIHKKITKTLIGRCDIIHIIGGPMLFRRFYGENRNALEGKRIIYHMMGAYWLPFRSFLSSSRDMLSWMSERRGSILKKHLKMLILTYFPVVFLNRASRIIVTCDFLKRWLVNKGVDKNRIAVIYPSMGGL